jgi:hypothetical protein
VGSGVGDAAGWGACGTVGAAARAAVVLRGTGFRDISVDGSGATASA